jgi:hypothetical protein
MEEEKIIRIKINTHKIIKNKYVLYEIIINIGEEEEEKKVEKRYKEFDIFKTKVIFKNKKRWKRNMERTSSQNFHPNY